VGTFSSSAVQAKAGGRGNPPEARAPRGLRRRGHRQPVRPRFPICGFLKWTAGSSLNHRPIEKRDSRNEQHIEETSTKPSSDPRIHLRMNAGSISFRALVDSGATISAMAKRVFQGLDSKHKGAEIPAANLRVTAASAEELRTEGYHFVRCRSEKLGEIEWPFVIAEKMTSEAIVGMDFLAFFKGKILAEKGEVHFESIPRNGIARLNHRIRLGPGELKRVRARPSTSSRGGLVWTRKNGPEIVEGISDWKSQEEGIEVLLVNRGDEEIELERGTEVAKYWQVEEEEVCTLEDFQRCRPANQQRKPISEEKKKLIREHTKTDLGPTFRRRITSVLEDNHKAISADKADLGRTAAVPHKLVTKSDKQVYRKQFPLPMGHQAFINKTVDDLLKIGAVKEDLASPHNTPIFAVRKPHSNDLRLVQDLRAVNENIENFQHPILDIPGCIAKLGGMKARYFAALDLTSGFYQLELDKESQPLTAFTVPGKGRFSWTVSTMGLKTSPGAFSRLMEHVMKEVDKTVTYIDDVIVAGETEDELLRNVNAALRQLRKFNLKLNIHKCVFGAKEVDYLGYRISADGARPGKEKTAAVVNFPTPSTVQEIRRFLGMANYFRSHIPHFAQKSKPLNELTRKSSEWREGNDLPAAAARAFQDIKNALSKEPIIALPQPNLPFTLETDGSSKGLGACLTQQQGNKVNVIAYASRALQKHEANYPAFLLEQAAAVFGIESFSTYLTNAHFQLLMDHKPLLALSSVHKKTLSRLQQLMSEYTFQLRYRRGESNAVADALSRAPVEALADSHLGLQQLQQQDPLCKAALEMCRGKEPEGLPVEVRRFLKRAITSCCIKDGCVYFMSENRPEPPRELFLTPRKCRYELMRAAHAGRFSGHGGEAKTLQRLQLRYFWPGMAADVADFIKSCEICQRSKNPPNWNRQRAPLNPLPVPDAPNERVHVDLFSLSRASNAGNKHILVATDAFSKLVELVPLPDKTAPTVATAIFNRWICRYACPKEIVSDQGREFCNAMSEELWQKLGIHHKRTAAYHPQTNTSAESFNRTLIKILRSMMDNPDGEWEALLPVVMLSYNTRVHSATRASPFFLTYLKDPNLPFFELEEERPLYGESWAASALQRLHEVNRLVKDNIRREQERGRLNYDAKTNGLLRTFREGEKVFVHFDPLSFPQTKNKKLIRTWLPHTIQRVITPTTYVVTADEPGRGHRRRSTVHVNRIKPRHQAPAQPGAEEQEEEEERRAQGEEPDEEAEGSQDREGEEEEENDGIVTVDIPPNQGAIRQEAAEDAEEEEEEDRNREDRGEHPERLIEERREQEEAPAPRPRTRAQARAQGRPPETPLTPPPFPREYRWFQRRQ